MKRLAVGWLASKCSHRRFCNYSKSSESDIFMDTPEQSSQGIGTDKMDSQLSWEDLEQHLGEQIKE